MRQPIWSLSTFALLALVLLGCGGGGQEGQQQGARPVSVANPEIREVTLWDDYIGRFEAMEQVELRPRVSGYVDEIHFRDGAIVEEGELLFTIDQRPFQAALDQARADLDQVRTSSRLSEAELARAKQLLDARAGSQEEYDRALQARDAARANFARSEAVLRQRQLDFDYTEIRSPIAGRLSQRRVDRGNLVSEGQTVLTTIVSIDPIHFAFTATEADYLRYVELDRTGARESSRDKANPVKIQIDNAEGFNIRGEMDFVDNAIDPATGTILGRAIVSNEDGVLAPGMFGEMRLFGRNPFEAMVIPENAIQFDQERQFVWVLSDGQAQMQFLELGRLVDGMRIVEDGLEPSAQVIVSGFMNLQPGAPVQDKSKMGQSPGGGTVAAQAARQ